MTKTGKKKKKRSAAAAGIAIAVIAVCFAAAYISCSPVDKSEKTAVLVTVEQGSGSSLIASALKEKNLIKSEAAFKLRAKMTGKTDDFKAGTYALNKSMSTGEIIAVIASGETAGKTFTVAEGQPIYKMAEQLDSAGIVDKKDFYNEIENGKFDYPFMKYLPEGTARLEGFLYPDTYEVAVDADAHEVLDVMLKRFNQVIGSDKDIFETVIKASVIQKEAGNTDEMKKVSSVIDNRIKKGMPLQMDSIISYIHKEDKIRATYSDIDVESDYNPYKNKGLPPGPICSPGKDAIDAAKNPDSTKYIYFVASYKMNGTNVFSTNYKDFLKDKKAFDKAYEKYIKEHPEAE